MAFEYRAPSNTLLQTVPGGTTATEENIDKVVEWVQAIEPRTFEWLDMITSSETFNNPIHKWGQSIRIDPDTTLPAGINATVTTIPVATGTGVRLQKYGVYRITNLQTGSTTEYDEANAEIVWVGALTNGVDEMQVVQRGVGDGGVGKAHTTNAKIEFLGQSEPQNDFHTEAPRIRGFVQYNVPQRFQAKMTADKRWQNTPTWEHPTNPLISDFAEEVVRTKTGLQRATFVGKRQAEAGAGQPGFMGGLNQFLTSNVVNLAGAALEPEMIESVFSDLWRTTTNSENKVMLMDLQTKQLLARYLNSMRWATTDDTSYNTNIEVLRFSTGEYPIKVLREIPQGSIYIVDTDLIKLKAYEGLNWHEVTARGEDHAVDHDVMAISGDFTLEVVGEKGMARIYNYSLDRADYPTHLGA